MPQDSALGLPPQAVWAVVLGIGLILGSFLNVVIYRLPLMEGYWREIVPLVDLRVLNPHPVCVGDHTVAVPLPMHSRFNLAWPPSSCTTCGNEIAWFDNIPVVSWVLLGGRCRSCRQPISGRYPLVEAITGALFLGAYLVFGLNWLFVGSCILSAALVVCFWIDLDYMILPDSVTLPLIWTGLLFHAARSALAHSSGGGSLLWPSPAGAILGAATGYVIFRAIETASALWLGRAGMGRGDAKLAAMMGAWLGPALLGVGLFAGFALGSLTGIVVEAARRRWNPLAALSAIFRHETRPFPFGPSLALGGAVAMFGGEHLVAWYLGLLRG